MKKAKRSRSLTALRSRKTRRAIDHRAVIRNRRILAGWIVVALVLEEFVADPHLDIIRLAGEHQQRRVLRLPAEPGNGAGIGAPVWMTADAHLALRSLICRKICENCAVRNRFDQTGAKDRSRNAKRYIVICELRIEIILNRSAIRCVAAAIDAAADDEQRVHATVRTPIRKLLETGFDNGTVGLNEKGHFIMRAVGHANIGLRIDARRRSPDARLGMTARTAVQIETRPEPIADALGFLESR